MAAKVDASEVDDLLREIEEANAVATTNGTSRSQSESPAPKRASSVSGLSASPVVTYSLLPATATNLSPVASKTPPPAAMPAGRRLAPLGSSPLPAVDVGNLPAVFARPTVEGLELTLPTPPVFAATTPARSHDPAPPAAASLDVHAVNFLPIMHGRYVADIQGIVPRGRWGHTFTTLGDSLLSFGGVTVDGTITNDLFDFQTGRRCWEPVHTSGRTSEADAPAPRAQHSAVGYQGRFLVVFGGTPDQGASCLGDVRWYDSLTRTWSNIGAESYRHEPTGRYGHSAVVYDGKMYIFGGKCARKVEGGDDGKGLQLVNDVLVFCLQTKAWKKRIHIAKDDTATPAPCKRYNHAACVLGSTMYVHGGETQGGKVLADTWAFSFVSKQWSLVHDETDSIPRCRHFMVGCGEALLVVGGAGPREPRPVPVAVMPVLETTEDGARVEPIQCGFTRWIPVPLGSLENIPATKKSFGGTVHSGFVYLFGGVTSTEQASSAIIRCLAMDGVPVAASPNLLLQEQLVRFLDDRALWDVQMSVGGDVVGAHRLILQHRVPKFYEELLLCKNDAESQGSGGARVADFEHLNPDSSITSQQRVPIYLMEGSSRAKGMRVEFSARTLRYFLEYVYGAVPPPIEDSETVGSQMMDIAVTYELVGLVNYLNAKGPSSETGTPKRSPTKLKGVQGGTRATAAKAMLEELGNDMCRLLENGSSVATATIVFQDPHTSLQDSHPVHPCVLAAASRTFRQLIVPLLADGKPSTQVGSIGAKRSAGAATSRRGIILGPVPLPLPSVKHVLRFLYRGALDVPAEVALPTMIAASTLGLGPLQAHCESVVAREEVNFETSCSYLALATTHKALLLEELALLTAALGYEDVRGTVSFNSLPPATQAAIQGAALELQGKWSAPIPKPQTEQRDTAVYQQRFAKSADGLL